MSPSDINGPLAGVAVSPIAARTATFQSSAVDVRKYRGGLMIAQHVGVVSGTTPTNAGKIQESADGSTDWQDVAEATFTSVTASDNLQKIGFDVRKTRGYIRYVGTIGGTTPSFTMGVTLYAERERS